jgi:hypothetical protein
LIAGVLVLDRLIAALAERFLFGFVVARIVSLPSVIAG